MLIDRALNFSLRALWQGVLQNQRGLRSDRLCILRPATEVTTAPRPPRLVGLADPAAADDGVACRNDFAAVEPGKSRQPGHSTQTDVEHHSATATSKDSRLEKRLSSTTRVTGRRRYALISDSAGFAAPVHAIVSHPLCFD
jgi:hypothetical protein